MKKYLHFIIVFISAFCLFSLVNSCTDEKELIEELNLANVLTPTSTSASISIYDGRTVTFTWTSSSTATQYVLEIYRWADGSQPSSSTEITADVLSGMSAYITAEVPQGTGTNTTYDEFLDVDYAYYARVKGQNPGVQGDSNWAVFRYPIEPYLIMDPLPTFKVEERASDAITLSWEIDADDEDGINQIRVTPDPDDANSSYKIFTVSSGATEYTVTGLVPSTEYTLSANFGTATRGTLVAWTRPDPASNSVEVADSAHFVNTVLDWLYAQDGPLTVLVDYKDGEIYDLPTIPVFGELTIIGLDTASGDKPVLQTNVSLYPAGSTYTLTYLEEDATGTKTEQTKTVEGYPGATKLRLEGLKFYGDNYGTNNLITAGSSFAGSGNGDVTVEMINCEAESYKCGIFYDNSMSVPYDAILFDGLYVEDTYGDGGDFIDIRTSSANSLTIQNSTFTDGCRTFIRFDSNSGANSVGNITITNNTINNVCTFDNSNNRGVLRFRCDITGDYELSNNLFLNNNAVTDYTVLIYQETDCHTPSKVSNNWYYNNNQYFLEDGNACKDFSESQGIAGGGKVLSNDPCYDSARGNFYVSDADVIGAKAGDPRWYGDYIAEPEAALVPVEYGYEWNLTDTKTFYDVIDQTVTRGNTRFLIDQTPIQVSADGFYFTDKATLMSFSGVPSDCGMGFIVNGPGSVVISTAEGRQTGLEVAYGIYDEEMVSISGQTTVAGSVSGGANKEMVVLGDLVEGNIYMVYIYSLGPVYMTQLVWSEEISAGGASLSVPTNLALSAESAASSETATLSWDAVANAGSYDVHIVGYNGYDETVSASGTSYNITGLDVGYYNLYVQAVPAESDSVREASEWTEDEILFFSSGSSTLSNVSAYSNTTWSSSTFEYLYGALTNGLGGSFTLDFNYDNLGFAGGNTNSILNDTVNKAGETVYSYSFGGGGSATARNLKFQVPGNGTLYMEIESGSGSGDSRWMKVFLDGVEYTTGENYGTSEETEATGSGYEAPIKGKPREHYITITGAQSGSEIMIYSAGSGILVLSLGWIPTVEETGGITPTDETINEEYLTDYSNEGTAAGYADVADGETLTVNKITYAGAITWDSSRYKMNGASKVGDDGVPTSRYASFKIATTGTITHKMISASGSDAERAYDVILVKEVGGETVVTTLYREYAPTSSGADAVTTEVTAEDLAGATDPVTVYVYVEANCNLYQIGYSPDN